MWVCVWVCAHVSTEIFSPPGVGLRGGCELTKWLLKTKPGSAGRAVTLSPTGLTLQVSFSFFFDPISCSTYYPLIHYVVNDLEYIIPLRPHLQCLDCRCSPLYWTYVGLGIKPMTSYMLGNCPMNWATYTTAITEYNYYNNNTMTGAGEMAQ